MLWIEFILSLIFSNQFKFFKLVHIFGLFYTDEGLCPKRLFIFSCSLTLLRVFHLLLLFIKRLSVSNVKTVNACQFYLLYKNLLKPSSTKVYLELQCFAILSWLSLPS